VLKRCFCFIWWPLLPIFSACFDCLNQIDTINDHMKRVFNVVKRNTNIKRHLLHGLVHILRHTTVTVWSAHLLVLKKLYQNVFYFVVLKPKKTRSKKKHLFENKLISVAKRLTITHHTGSGSSLTTYNVQNSICLAFFTTNIQLTHKSLTTLQLC